MKTSIFVPICIVLLCLASLGVLVWQAFAPPPLTANNQIAVTPSAPALAPMAASSSTLAPEAHAVAPAEPVATPTPVDVSSSGDASVKAGTSTSADNYVDAACKVGGCSGQLCEDSSAPAGMTTCEMKHEYACYHSKGARCEVQKSGKLAGHCGWTPSQELTACLTSSKGPVAQ